MGVVPAMTPGGGVRNGVAPPPPQGAARPSAAAAWRSPRGKPCHAQAAVGGQMGCAVTATCGWRRGAGGGGSVWRRVTGAEGFYRVGAPARGQRPQRPPRAPLCASPRSDYRGVRRLWRCFLVAASLCARPPAMAPHRCSPPLLPQPPHPTLVVATVTGWVSFEGGAGPWGRGSGGR